IEASAGTTARLGFTTGGGPAGVREPRRPGPSGSGTRERLLVEATDGLGAVDQLTAALDAAGVPIRSMETDTVEGRLMIRVDVGVHGEIGERVLQSVGRDWIVERETT